MLSTRPAAVLLAFAATTACRQFREDPAEPLADHTAVAQPEPDAPVSCPKSNNGSVSDPLRYGARAQGDRFIEILDVHAADQRIYACTGTQGLTIWSDPEDRSEQPELLAEGLAPTGAVAHPRFPRCQHVDVAGEKALVTSHGDEVQPKPFIGVLDVSRPGQVKTIASTSGASSYEGALFVGEQIVAAAHGDGLVVLKAKGKRLVKQGGFVDDESDAWQPVAHGENILVAEGETGLRVYAIKEGVPQLLGGVELAGSSKDVVVQGDVAYVATSLGVASVDVSDPAAPRVLAEVTTAGTALGVSLGRPGTLFVADWNRVRAFDITDPAAPKSMLSEAVPTDADFSRVLALDATTTGRMYAGEWQGLHVYEHQGSGEAPQIELLGTPVRLGRTGMGESTVSEFSVHNSGALPLTITSIESSQDQLAVTPPCTQVAPGETATLDVRLSQSTRAEFSGKLTIHSDDPDEAAVTVDVLANHSGASIGEDVPPFDVVDREGKRWSSKALRGKVVVLAYFATF